MDDELRAKFKEWLNNDTGIRCVRFEAFTESLTNVQRLEAAFLCGAMAGAEIIEEKAEKARKGGPMKCPIHGGYGFYSDCTECKS